MTKTAVAADIDQPTDVHLHLTPEVSFNDCPTLIKSAPNPIQFFFTEISDTGVAVKCRFSDHALGYSLPYAVNGLEGDLYTLVIRYVHSSHECHLRCSLKPGRFVIHKADQLLADLRPD